MKRPLGMKFDLLLHRHKLVTGSLIIVITILVISSLTYFVLSLKNNGGNTDSSFVGVFGTLLGSVVGGVLSFVGSVYVNSRKLSSEAAIRRKEEIYEPLYNDLIKNKNIVRDNPYPNQVSFDHDIIDNIPNYSAWKKIKNDSRYIQTSKILANNLEKLNDKIRYYKESLLSSQIDVNDKAKQILQQVADNPIMQDLGNVFLPIICYRNYPTGTLFKHSLMPYQSLDNLSEDQFSGINKVEQVIYDECNELESVQTTVQAYNDWQAIQDELISYLEDLICLTNVKHEKLDIM